MTPGVDLHIPVSGDLPERVVVVGGGILGTMHAFVARQLGVQVVHLERDAEPRSATVRNFGLVWVSGRRPGPETREALRARVLWESISAVAPGIGFRPDGSLTLATHPAEVEVMDAVSRREDSGARGFRMLGPDEVRSVNPVVRGDVLAGLHCATDAVVEPRAALPALRQPMSGDGYAWHPGTSVVGWDGASVLDHRGTVHSGDLVIVCPGASVDGAVAELLEDRPVRPVMLQMLQTEPLGERMTTSLADGNSLRYYPAFDVPELADLPPAEPLVAEHGMQLLISQRATGELTIGDTHAYDQPFDFAVDEAPSAWLLDRAATLLGRSLPAVRRRWSGVYAQLVDDGICLRDEVVEGLWLVTGPGGRGMTLAPAIAETTWAEVLR